MGAVYGHFTGQTSLNYFVMKPLYLILLMSSLLHLVSPPARAQSYIHGGAGFLYGGKTIWPGLAGAVGQQVGQSSAGSSDRYTVLGANAYYRADRWLFGVDASALVNTSLPAASVEYSASSAYGWIGWIVWENNRFTVYPSVGPGYNSLAITQTSYSTETKTRTLTGFSTDLGVTLSGFVFKSAITPPLSAGTLISVRAGYRFTNASSRWQGDQIGGPVPDANPYAAHGFYLTLGIGGGGFRRRAVNGCCD